MIQILSAAEIQFAWGSFVLNLCLYHDYGVCVILDYTSYRIQISNLESSLGG